ncbi:MULTISPECIES: nucleotide exchange factor GrpE [Thermomonospora]|uniref:Protein GrpE n=1 Tax=Thermomonospora cellulosilytica TaxID=1411118 RepID=A0A7W3MV41_9ACTN|nr:MULTISPECIES: nucleotide exchange factor GrpE [Thermomonospora]MBA9002440.1 molecular chaperone GrpE [Thermomonospora cellulosilytica]
MSSPDKGEEREGPVIRDRRRIDPETGKVREQAAEEAAAPGPAAEPDTASAPAGDEIDALKAQLEERTGDLQRLQAEFSNYRKRVERDRVAVREQALANVLTELLPVLDDIGRARDHGELTGGFKSVAEALEATVTKLGLQRFGEKGEPFDPTVHEALLHSYSSEVTETTCSQVLQPGYRIGERILRPARVAVAEPGEPQQQEQEPAAETSGESGSSDDE